MENPNKRNLPYGKIGRIWCPSLKDDVAFDNNGFRHLIWKGRKHRPESDRKRRFALLKYAPEIVAHPNSNINYKEQKAFSIIERHGKKIAKASRAKFWALSKKCDGKMITVVIRQIKSGKKHFFSIYDE